MKKRELLETTWVKYGVEKDVKAASGSRISVTLPPSTANLFGGKDRKAEVREKVEGGLELYWDPNHNSVDSCYTVSRYKQKGKDGVWNEKGRGRLSLPMSYAPEYKHKARYAQRVTIEATIDYERKCVRVEPINLNDTTERKAERRPKRKGGLAAIPKTGDGYLELSRGLDIVRKESERPEVELYFDENGVLRAKVTRSSSIII